MPDANQSPIVRHASGALDFKDSSGMTWTVSEIARMEFSERLMSLLPHPERRQGWLLFESNLGERRRLTPVPADWQALSCAVLERYLNDAVRSSGAERRRRSDLER
jgi:hypothetical protein